MLRVVLVEETAFLQGKQRLLRLQAVDGQPAAPAPSYHTVPHHMSARR